MNEVYHLLSKKKKKRAKTGLVDVQDVTPLLASSVRSRKKIEVRTFVVAVELEYLQVVHC
mgnify:CR=1 FL=1